jgi:choline dehydrogenase-like flavoprotein
MLEAGPTFDTGKDGFMFKWAYETPRRGAAIPTQQFGEFDAALGGWTLEGEPYTNAPGDTWEWFRSRMLGGRTNHWGRISLRFGLRHRSMCSIALSGRLLCLTGRLSVFRASVATDPTFLNQIERDSIRHWLWGTFDMLSGDDKSTWYWLAARGKRMLYVPDAMATTVEVVNGSALQRAVANVRRWSGNSLRHSWRAFVLGPKKLGWFCWYSLSGLLGELKRDLARIAAMLRPGDRLRLLTFGYQVDDVFGWRPAAADLPVENARVGRLSSVSDAILLALLHRPQVDRRHLVIAMTDAMDAGSQVEMSQLRAVSARSEAVLHVMVMPSAYSPPPNMPGSWGVGVPELVSAPLTEVAERTGGRLHSATFGRVSVVNGFSQAFEDFRQSYILHYTPTGVARVGWHEIQVHVPAEPRLTIRARKGYFGS